MDTYLDALISDDSFDIDHSDEEEDDDGLSVLIFYVISVLFISPSDCSYDDDVCWPLSPFYSAGRPYLRLILLKDSGRNQTGRRTWRSERLP